MPAAAMRTRRKGIRTTMRRMMAHRTIMVTIITMTSIAIMTIIMAIPMLMTTSKAQARPRRRTAVRTSAISQPEERVERLASEDPAQPTYDRSGMKESEAAALYRLMTWLSPSFPVGAFSYSSGIEWAVEAGDIGDAASLKDWLSSMLAAGPGFCDGVFLAHSHRAASSRDDAGLRDVAELAAAFVPSRERQLETSAQGRAFVDIARAAWNCDGLDRMIEQCGGTIVYPIAVGVVSAAHEIPLASTMHAFLHV